MSDEIVRLCHYTVDVYAGWFQLPVVNFNVYFSMFYVNFVFQSDLLFFSALLSSFMPTEGSKIINFLYNVPVTRNATTIDISMTANDVHNIWLR